jgi:hypothetical protein
VRRGEGKELYGVSNISILASGLLSKPGPEAEDRARVVLQYISTLMPATRR